MLRNRKPEESKQAGPATEIREGIALDVRGLLGLGIVLVLFAVAAIGPRMGLSFVGDDYVFLNKTRTTGFAALWSLATSVDFGWYRPWSREVHYWVLQRFFGIDVAAYRVVNVALWVVALCLYAAVVARLSSQRVAAIAALGVAGLAFWGTPFLWISGSQDLWMLTFLLLSLLLFIVGRPVLALPPFALALLSKEIAGVLPALICAHLLIVEHRTVRDVLRRTWSFWGVLMVWAILHPTLRLRLLGGLPRTLELEHRPPWPLIVLKSIAACINLDKVPHPQEVTAGVVCSVLLMGLLLAGGIYLAARRHGAGVPKRSRKSLMRLAGAWMLIGWLPLLLPSIGWHAYYGCVGALGAWFGLALWLESRPVVAMVAIVAVVGLRGAQANTLSSDFGDETYFRRAGSTLAAIRDDLLRQRPTLPPHSRVYFTEIPSYTGLIAGDSPALRVWYGDNSLEAGYYSYYRPRDGDAPSGTDYFFRFDAAVGMVEVKVGEEDVQGAIRANPRWESDHDGLARLFLDKGDLNRAAVEFEKLSLLHHRPDAAVDAAECYGVLGDSVKAESLFHAAQVRLHTSGAQMTNLTAQVRRDIVARRR